MYKRQVEIKAVSREAGSRTKLAVISHNSDVDAVGACIGARGARVSSIVNELGGEKIDIVESVSYTHLDVYKRQRRGCPTGFCAVGRKPACGGKAIGIRAHLGRILLAVPVSYTHL